MPDVKSAPYRCVLVADEKVNDKKMAEIADWLVKTGCLYFILYIARQPNQKQLISLFSKVKNDMVNGNIALH